MSRTRSRLLSVVAFVALLAGCYAVVDRPPEPETALEPAPESMTFAALAADTSEPLSVLAARWATAHPQVALVGEPRVGEEGEEGEGGSDARAEADAGEAGPIRVGDPNATESASGERRMPTLPVGPTRAPAGPRALQTVAGGNASVAVGGTLEGVGQGFTGPFGTFSVAFLPPDVNGDVGDRQYVETVNTQMAVMDKATGDVQLGPVNTNALWQGFGGLCQTDNDGDPTVRWDGLAKRWIVTQFAVSGTSSTNPYLECIAVSRTEDATGRWYRYAFPHPKFPDYPKLSVWPNAYYVTYNYFTRKFAGGVICAYPRERLLAGPDGSSGSPVAGACQTVLTDKGSFLVSDLDAVAGEAAPVAGAKAVGVLLYDTSTLGTYPLDYAPATNTLTVGPLATVPVSSYTPACNGGVCIPQGGTSTKLDSLGDRLMYRFAYRPNAARTAGTAVVAHSVTSNGVAAIRWYQLALAANGAATLLQEGTYQPDSLHRWMPSIAQDAAGNIAVGYSASSSSAFPSIRFAARAAGTAAGAGILDRSESVIAPGGGSQNGSYTRWGDYTNMSLDPDGCTFWYAGEYMRASHAYQWSTKVGRFSVDAGCGAISSAARSTATVAAPDATQTVAAGGKVTVRATVSDGATPLEGRIVVFTLFGKSAWGTTNASGVASATFSAPRKSGTSWTVTRSFPGDWSYAPATGATSTVTIQ